MQFSKTFAKGLFPALFCMLAVLLAACGGGGSSSDTSTTKASTDKQIYIRPYTGLTDVKTLDPAMVSDLYSTQSVMMVYTGLVTLNDKMQVADQLAASHSVDAAGTTWTFKLKPNLKFSDGTPLTSADVVYSIDRALDPALKSPTSSFYLALIKNSAKRAGGKEKSLIGDSLLDPNPQTVIIKTSQKSAYFLESLTMPNSFVVEKSLVEKYGNNFTNHLDVGGGAGPWIVSKHVPGKEIDFTPNTNYYGAQPQLKKVVYPFYQSADTAYNAYQTNQVDAAAIPSAKLAQAKAQSGQFVQFPILSNSYIAMNYLAKPFDNIKIRQAFALAINKDEIAHNIYKDTVIATNHIVPQGMPGYNPNLTAPAGATGTNGNPDMAKQLLQEGLKEEGMSSLPPITYTTASAGSADARNTDAALQQMWQNTLGVNVKIDDIDFNKLLDETSAATNNAKGIQMWSIGWIADYPDPQDWLTLQFDNGSAQNNMNYGQNTSPDAAAQKANQLLMEKADANLNPASRLQQYQKAEQQAVNDVAWAPLYQQTVTSLRKACVAGIVNNSQDLTPPDSWGHIYKTTDSSCADVSQYQ